MMDAKLITAEEHSTSTVRCAYDAGEAAQMLGVAEATVRRVAKKLGVRKIAGRSVAGFVRFASSPTDVSMPYHR